MTPLYHRLVKRLTLPERKRPRLLDPYHLLDDLSDVHCFECTEVFEVVRSLVGDRGSLMTDAPVRKVAPEVLFLPAERAWVEWCGRDGVRYALFMQDGGSNVSLVTEVPLLPLIAMRIAVGGHPVVDSGTEAFVAEDGGLAEGIPKEIRGMCFALSHILLAGAFLSVINSPRIVGRTAHTAHKRIAREVSRQFKVHPWHEIKLEVFKPRDCGEDGGEGWLTGRRALHFCRAFIRIRNGRLEHVRSHWRGDPALGVRQASYRVGP
jgi:hypothetical protein